jgi:hypothetical protein
VKVRVWHTAGLSNDATLPLDGKRLAGTRGESENYAHAGLKAIEGYCPLADAEDGKECGWLHEEQQQ